MAIPPVAALRRLDLLALSAQLGVDAPLLDRAHAARRDAQRYPALLGLEPEALRVQVRQETAALLVVRVRDAVADGRALARDLTDAGHKQTLRISSLGIAPGAIPVGAGLYTSPRQPPQGASAHPCPGP